SSRTHLVHTAVCVARGALGGTQPADRGSAPPVDHPYDVALDTATVAMHPIDTDALERYLATGESLDKAGAYAVQGEAAQFVREVTGHLTTVVGLPVRVVERLLAPFGLLPSQPHP
ncbi:MAG: Maf family protein, partial [Actinomycetota bacterium]